MCLFSLILYCFFLSLLFLFFIIYPFLYLFGKGKHFYPVAGAFWPACINREWESISSGIVRTSVWAELQVISGVLLRGTSRVLEHASQGGAFLAMGVLFVSECEDQGLCVWMNSEVISQRYECVWMTGEPM